MHQLKNIFLREVLHGIAAFIKPTYNKLEKKHQTKFGRSHKILVWNKKNVAGHLQLHFIFGKYLDIFCS